MSRPTAKDRISDTIQDALNAMHHVCHLWGSNIEEERTKQAMLVMANLVSIQRNLEHALCDLEGNDDPDDDGNGSIREMASALAQSNGRATQ